MKSLLLFCLLVASCLARADGAFFGPSVVEAKPTIPYQRAAISYRAGIESMVVESVLNAPAGDYSWVVPLPTEPTSIDKLTSSDLSTLTQALTPVIDTGSQWPFRVVYVFSGIALFVILSAPIRYRRQAYGGARRLLAELAATSGLAVAAYFLVPGLFSPGAGKRFYDSTATAGAIGGMDGVSVLQSAKVGSYDVNVIEGKTADALMRWLSANGTPLPEATRGIVAQYAREGWIFMAAKLSHEGGSLRPHPLSVTFPTKAAIYPMRLTAAATPELELDLVVVGERLGTLEEGGLYASQLVDEMRYPRGGRADSMMSSFGPFGSGPITSLLWDGCTVSRTRASLKPSQMSHDFQVRWEAPRNYRLKVLSDEGAGAIGMAYGFLGGTVGAFLLTLWWLRRPNFDEMATLSSTLFGLIVGVIVWFAYYHLSRHIPVETLRI